MKPYFPVIVINRDMRGIMESAFTLVRIAEFLDRDLVFEMETGQGIALHRTAGLKRLRAMGFLSPTRGLMLDGDVLLPLRMAGHFADAIKQADDRHLNIVSPVKLITGNYNIAIEKGDKDGINAERLSSLKDWTRVYAGGLAFYYGDLITDYRFHEGDNDYGEDWNYLFDNHLPVNVVKLPTYHYKEMLL